MSHYPRFQNDGSSQDADGSGSENRTFDTGTVGMRPDEAPASSSTNTDGDVNEYERNDNEFFSKLQNITGRQTCLPEHPQQTTHFSDLPIELVLYIMRLVTSDENDITKCRILDELATVCRGWYVCARDHIMYRQACSKIWSNNRMRLHRYGGNWRIMFLTRPVIHTSGCYIAYQDYYPRFHYLRFYPYGRFVYLKTKLPPHIIIPIIKNVDKTPFKQIVQNGVYKLTNDKIMFLFNIQIDARHWNNHLDNPDTAGQRQRFKFTIQRRGIRIKFCSHRYHKYLNRHDNFFNFFSIYHYFSFTSQI